MTVYVYAVCAKCCPGIRNGITFVFFLAGAVESSKLGPTSLREKSSILKISFFLEIARKDSVDFGQSFAHDGIGLVRENRMRLNTWLMSFQLTQSMKLKLKTAQAPELSVE